METRKRGWVHSSNQDLQYLPNDPDEFFHDPVKGPDDTGRTTPDWFMCALVQAAEGDTETPKRSPLQFETNDRAAEANAKLLEAEDFSLANLIRKFADTTLGYGSEFRIVKELRPLIGRHPNFDKLAQILTEGMPYVFKRELDPVTKMRELRTLVRRGNHKFAQDFPNQVQSLLAKDPPTSENCRETRGSGGTTTRTDTTMDSRRSRKQGCQVPDDTGPELLGRQGWSRYIYQQSDRHGGVS
jgi:hypothetical protein